MMGQCLGSEAARELQTARTHSARIDRDLYQSAMSEMNVTKILLLGAAESGKSTLVKQMKIIHSTGFSTEELSSFKPAVRDNLLTSMRFVLRGMGQLHISLSSSRNQVHALSVLSCGRCFDEALELRPFLGHTLSCLWADLGVRAAAHRGHEYQLNDSALYFFENMSRIAARDYVPTETDLLRVRLRTTGVMETQFKVKHLQVRLCEVGGQQTQSRKWLGCFQDVRALLFVASLSGYDMTLGEEPSQNRLQESLKLFSSVCNNLFFRDTTTILFMNKVDLFQHKILHSGRHLRLYLPRFTGADCDVEAAARFVAASFAAAAGGAAGRPTYGHFTTATDTAGVALVFRVVMETIVRENLEAVALL